MARMTRPAPSLRQRLFARLMKGLSEDSDRHLGPRRAELLAPVEGDVVELGPGTGANFRHLPPGVRWVGVEPNPAMHVYLRAEAAAHDVAVRLVGLADGRIELEDASADFVISTHVLCSVPVVAEALAEVHRVLRPGGQYLFLEHVAATPDSPRHLVQRIAPWTPWWYFSDGCDPGRDLGTAIRQGPFAEVSLEEFPYPGRGAVAWVVRPQIMGVAIKAGG